MLIKIMLINKTLAYVNSTIKRASRASALNADVVPYLDLEALTNGPVQYLGPSLSGPRPENHPSHSIIN